MLEVEKALEIALEKTEPLASERRPLHEAVGKFAPRDVLASEDHPPFGTAAMDGYALRSEDTWYAPVSLEVVDDVPAGSDPSKEVKMGQAAKIMTGAPIPPGADAVIRVEDTSGFVKVGGTVKINVKVEKGNSIRGMGENIKKGETALSAGQLIRSEEIAILATLGIPMMEVVRDPQVGIVSTGDEIIDIDQPLKPGCIRNSNAYMLQSLLSEMRLRGDILGVARDDRGETVDLIQKGMKKDMLLITGGVSVGERDFVSEALKEQGVEIHFEKLKLKPGKPTVFGTSDHCTVFGLPGNPVSSLVTFLILVRPVLYRMMGSRRPQPFYMKAELGEKVPSYNRRRYLPAVISEGPPRQIKLVKWKGSGDIFSLNQMSGLAVFPPEEAFRPGQMIDFLPRF